MSKVAAARKAFTDHVCEMYSEMLGGGPYPDVLRKRLTLMSDSEFEDTVKKIESGEQYLPIQSANFSKYRPNTGRNLEIAKKIGYEFFRRVWVPATRDTPSYLSPKKAFIAYVPCRRQAQLLAKKISIPEHNRAIDDLTGQPTGKSKGSRISYPELQVLNSMDMQWCSKEFMGIRGGDVKGFIASNALIARTGGASIKSIEPYRSGVEANNLLYSVLIAMMLNNTLIKRN